MPLNEETKPNHIQRPSFGVASYPSAEMQSAYTNASSNLVNH